LHRDGLIIKKPTVVHSRARVALRNEAKRKGRHTGTLLDYIHSSCGSKTAAPGCEESVPVSLYMVVDTHTYMRGKSSIML
jgi:hypothetical protein